MSEEPIVTLDVRDQLRAGGEPFGRIMDAVAQLSPHQSLRLLATFEPHPLFAHLATLGFAHQTTKMAEDDWEVLFTRSTEKGE